MSATQDGNTARHWTRSTVLISASAALAICTCSPSRAEERRSMCEQQGETLAIYDCQTGLVLWSRRPSEPMPPMDLSDRQLCRLVVGPAELSEDAGRCL